MEAKAVLRNARVAPRKAGLVADLIRGKGINEALADLRFLPKKNLSELYSKLLKSAAANAENLHQVDVDSLVVQTVVVNKGRTLKRWRPRAMGRAFRIEKKTCHIAVTLASR